MTRVVAGGLLLTAALAVVLVCCCPAEASASDGTAERVINRMIAAHGQGNYEEARSHGNTIRAMTPQPSARWLGYNEVWLAVTYQKMGDVEKAVDAFRRALPYLAQATAETSGSRRSRVISYVGRAYRGLSEDWNTITPRNERLEELAPKAIERYLTSARGLQGQERQYDLEDAGKLSDRVIAYAREHFEAGRLMDADRALGKLLKVNPGLSAAEALHKKVADAAYSLSDEAYRQIRAKDVAAAEAAFRTLQERWPEHPQLEILRPLIEEMFDDGVLAAIREHLERGDFQEGLAAANGAFIDSPNHPEVLRLRVRAYAALGRPADVLSDIDVLRAEGAYDHELALIAAEAQFDLEQWDRVIETCDTILRMAEAPRQTLQRASDLSASAAEERERPADFADARAEMERLLDSERYVEAEMKADAMLRLYPDRLEAHILAAIAYTHRSNLDRARVSIETALARRGELPSSEQRAGDVIPSVAWAIQDFSRADEEAVRIAVAVCGWLLLGDGVRAGAVCDRIERRSPWNVDRQLLALVHMLWGAAQYVAGVGEEYDDQIDAEYGKKGPRAHFTRACAMEKEAVSEAAREITEQVNVLRVRIGMDDGRLK
ncbi:MAG: hypothetical protein ACLFU7_14280 [Armatimonadota bacterium]